MGHFHGWPCRGLYTVLDHGAPLLEQQVCAWMCVLMHALPVCVRVYVNGLVCMHVRMCVSTYFSVAPECGCVIGQHHVAQSFRLNILVQRCSCGLKRDRSAHL